MQFITIGFSKASTSFSIFSWAIMLTEQTPYSHVYIKYWDEQIERNVYFQASHLAVNFMGNSIFNSQETIIAEFNFEISDENFRHIKRFALANVGKPYGILSIVGLSLVQLLKIFGIKIHNPLKEAGSTYICSQLVASVLEKCININIKESLNDITPKDLFAIISKLPTRLN